MTRAPRDPAAPAGPVRRIIHLNGQETGLSAYTRNQALDAMSRVLIRKGHHNATPAALAATYATGKGRVDFTWPPKA